MRRHPQNGQALVLVTLCSFALFGLMALAVDLGWSHYGRKAAQGAADAAALAAVKGTLAAIGQGGGVTCGTTVTCQAATACGTWTSGGNAILQGCMYAQQNGFTNGGDHGRQTVTIQSGTTSPPLAPGIATIYWATARTGQTMPQLFSAVLRTPPKVSASATAAILETSQYGSLMLLNHENDCLPEESTSHLTCGVNLLVSANDNQGHYALQADGGIFMASQKNGKSSDGRYAGENSGGGTIKAPFTNIRGNGWYSLSGSSRWVETPTKGGPDSWFQDPMAGKGQPKAPTGLTDKPIANGTIVGSSDANNPLVLLPGNYYATNASGTTATGSPIDIQGYVRFSSNGSGFGNYVFFGGVQISHNSTVVTFEPGMYVYAGVQGGGPVFNMTANATLKDLTSGYGANSDAGEIFIFTDTNYRGQGEALQIPTKVASIASTLKQGTSGFQAGNNGVTINLHGLNKGNASLPSQLQPFAPMMLWQDQANSVIKYDSNGNIDTSCGNSDGCANTSLVSNTTPQMYLQGSPTVHIYGAAYAPRGAWTSIIGGGDYQVPVQVITGSLRVQGNANFSMIQPANPITRRVVALIQ